jgi:hypothetical protein
MQCCHFLFLDEKKVTPPERLFSRAGKEKSRKE